MKYTSTLFDLLPPGLFNSANSNSNIYKLLRSVSDELASAEQYAVDGTRLIFAQNSNATHLRKWAELISTEFTTGDEV